jgi:hypothetical protein
MKVAKTHPVLASLRHIPSGFRVIVSVVLLAATSAAAQQVTLERDSALYGEPRLDSAQVAQLKQGATGEVVAKQGAWLNLKTSEGSGWLFSFNVRFQSTGEGAGGSSGSGSALGRLFGPRRAVSVTSTIGVRGLEEEDLKQAALDPEQLKKLDGYAVTKEAAEEGARAAGLSSANVEYLKDTK